MDTLNYFIEKFHIDMNVKKPPMAIPNINRKIMAETFRELNFTVGAEIGVAEGEHSLLLCRENPQLKLYCIDAWQGYTGYRDYLDARLKSYYNQTKEKLAPYNAELIQKFSMDAVKDFHDETLDFVYLDGAHDFKNIAMDICEWSKKVKVGGVVYGHDFKRHVLGLDKYLCHVVDVVYAYTYSHGINPWFILGEKGPPDGKYQEGVQSWMYVKTTSNVD